MFGTLKQILGGSTPAIDFAGLKARGAQIVDVRSADEFGDGHVAGSVNIPLGSLERSLTLIRRDRPVITCCASGMRSASAKSLLERQGYAEVHNGGGWAGLQRRLAG
jgi:rhodanese-related sulfurtransferase